ncbi:hypothetical protein CHELA20_50806 [Hyphomicrobiales bacterium]|nr:hypothetical protein CHELA20_50806 [Hyphomicrobiales bacterium]CAH1676177.1 hypothetical protein CHELA41_24213 [Hyphomicrobiales bacterium]
MHGLLRCRAMEQGGTVSLAAQRAAISGRAVLLSLDIVGMAPKPRPSWPDTGVMNRLTCCVNRRTCVP